MRRSAAPRPQQQTTALLLRAVNYGEADRICTLLTPTLGKIACFAGRARAAKSRFRGGLGPFAELRVAIAASEEGLSKLVESDAGPVPPALLAHLDRMTVGAYATELLDLALQDGQGAELYETATRFVAWLGGDVGGPHRLEAGLHRFELLLMHTLGLLPDLATCAETGAPLDDGARWVDGVGLVAAASGRHATSPLLDSDAIAWLRGVGSGRCPNDDAPATRAAVRDALQRAWTSQLQRAPRSYAMMNEALSGDAALG